jgi:hypothetical protein
MVIKSSDVLMHEHTHRLTNVEAKCQVQHNKTIIVSIKHMKNKFIVLKGRISF